MSTVINFNIVVKRREWLIFIVTILLLLVSLIKKMFPNANIVIDNFHLIQLISRSLNKTRINIMKKDKKNYNKLKRYWKLLLKSKDELDFEKWKKFTCFNSSSDVRSCFSIVV